MKQVIITGMGHGFPTTVLDNQFFESLGNGSSASWIEERIGILQRRSVLKLEDIRALAQNKVTRRELVKAGLVETMGQMAEVPWAMAIDRSQRSGFSPSPDLVISGTSVPDWDIPANACAIAHHLGIEASGFDVNSACSSFVVDLHVARGLLNSGLHQRIAIFNVERYTTRLDFSDRASCILFGDGASAAIVESVDGPVKDSFSRGFVVIDSLVRSSPAGHHHVVLPDGETFSQNGPVVQKFAVGKTVSITQEILAKNGLDTGDIQYFIGHQANLRMLKSVVERLKLTDRQHLWNVDQYGNQGGAGAPNVLSSYWETFRSGDLVVIAVVGSGLTWGSVLLKAI